MKKIYTILLLMFLTAMAACTTMPTTQQEEVPAGEPVVEQPEAAPEESNFAVFEGLTVSQGEHADKIVLGWEAEEGATAYAVLRSEKKDEAYEQIAEVQESGYEDADVEPGRKYYYRVIRLASDDQAGSDESGNEESSENQDFEVDDTSAGTASQFPRAYIPESEDTDNSNYGYAKVSRPAKKNLDSLMRSYTKGKSGPYTEEEKKYQSAHLAFLKEKYEHSVKLNMILTMTRPYLNSGRLEIHSGFTSYKHNREVRMMYLFNEDHSAFYMFNQNTVSENLVKEDMKSLMERLMINSVAFCGYRGDKEVIDENGIERVIPSYDVVALAAQYWPRYSGWKDSTWLIVTSDKRLKREIQKAQSN